MKNTFKIFLLAIISLMTNFSNGQIQPNNTRYLAYAEVYPYTIDVVDNIQTAKNFGCNAVNLTIDYRSANGFNPIPNYWAKIGACMAKAKSLNMKIGIRVLVDNSCLTSTLGDPNNNYPQICDDINPQERMIGKLLNGTELVHQQAAGRSPTNADEYEQRVMISLASVTQKNRITSFTNEILDRYKVTYGNDILWMNVAYTSEQEGGFPYFTDKGNGGDVLFDYSAPMVNGFRAWLQTKYVNIAALNAKWASNFVSFTDPSLMPKLPTGIFKSAFMGNDGKDWWTYRTKVIRDATEIFATTVRSQASQIRVITDYGSVYDVLSLRRGTYNFKDINANSDGMKINDAPYYDHRFAVDLMRSNLPGKFIANEVEWSAGQSENGFRQFGECFNHGANWVNIFQFKKMVDAGLGSQLLNVANTYLGSAVPTISPTQTATFNLSSMLNSEGCSFVPIGANQAYVETNNCEANNNWKAKFSISNSPVNLVMVDDITETIAVVTPPNTDGCNVSIPTGVTANPLTIVSGGSATLSGNCPFGSTIVYNSLNGSTMVAPTATTIYTAKCVAVSVSSVSSNVITISPGIIPLINIPEKVLVLGNSFVHHPAVASLGWAGDWGMAASSSNTDMMQRLRNHYTSLNSSNIVLGNNIFNFENNFASIVPANDNLLVSIRDAQNWTTIILRIGENVNEQNGYNSAIFKQKCLELINFIKNGRNGVKVIITNCFWSNAIKDADLQSLAATNNFPFASLSGLYAFGGANTGWVGSPNAAVLSDANAGVLNHPNDAGMLAIANRIIAVISQ